jgi:hypothetical protein
MTYFKEGELKTVERTGGLSGPSNWEGKAPYKESFLMISGLAK